MKRWCVMWNVRDECGFVVDHKWCALKENKLPPEEKYTGAKTLCDHVVVLPGGYEQREPDCEECLEVLKGETDGVSVQNRQT